MVRETASPHYGTFLACASETLHGSRTLVDGKPAHPELSLKSYHTNGLRLTCQQSIVEAPEQSFGWMKMIGLLRKVKLRGLEKVSWWFTFVGAAYNLIRLRRLRAEAVA